jgi:hypothetical protein
MPPEGEACEYGGCEGEDGQGHGGGGGELNREDLGHSCRLRSFRFLGEPGEPESASSASRSPVLMRARL